MNSALMAVAGLAWGAGYAIWYSVLQHIKATTATVMQLSVPALAALGGVLLLAEPLTLRIVLATVLTLGGIALFLRRLQRA
jgi:drug/metabolite transporter (DMT)-like permease